MRGDGADSRLSYTRGDGADSRLSSRGDAVESRLSARADSRLSDRADSRLSDRDISELIGEDIDLPPSQSFSRAGQVARACIRMHSISRCTCYVPAVFPFPEPIPQSSPSRKLP